MNITVQSLHARAFKGHQSSEFSELVEMQNHDVWPYERHRLQVSIDRDSYDFQSSAKISRWDGAEWKAVASIPYTEMRTGDIAYKRVPAEEDFEADRRDLINLASLVFYAHPWEGES